MCIKCICDGEGRRQITHSFTTLFTEPGGITSGCCGQGLHIGHDCGIEGACSYWIPSFRKKAMHST
jgi:hypothetical protein